jgi:hypothetical protein
MQSKKPASFKFDKKQRVLVMVELHEGVSAPPTFTTSLADAIGSKLWANKAVEAPLVRQDQLITLQQSDPAGYSDLHLGDIAHKVGADAILHLYITKLQTNITADGTVAEGYATAYVKVVDKDGKRLWPGNVEGTPINAALTAGLLSDRDVAGMVKALGQQITDQTEVLFRQTNNDARHISQ